MISLSVKDNEMDMGAVISCEYKEETFKVRLGRVGFKVRMGGWGSR